MKRFSFFFAIAIVFCACNSSSSENKPGTTINSRQQAEQNLEPFADSLVRLDKYSLESLDKSADYYSRLVPADSSLADSAAVIFLRHISTVVDTINQILFNDTTDYFDLVYNNNANAPEEQKQFQQNLLRHHIILQPDGEGGVYAVADYDWVNKLVQSKTSAAVDRYLSLLAREEKNPALLDAGLAININELADRLVVSEELAKAKLPITFLQDVQQRHRFYINTFLFGSDNSPALDYTNAVVLTSEFKTGYDYLQATYPNSEAAKMIAEWRTVVSKKHNKAIDQWREKYQPQYD